MINPFKYIPVKINHNPHTKAYLESKWGWTIYKTEFGLCPEVSVALIPRELYKRIKAFLVPVDGQYEWQQMENKISQEMTQRLFSQKNGNRFMPTVKAKEVFNLFKNVEDQWKERISHTDDGLSTIFQYNARISLFGDNWIRQLVIHSDHYEAPNKPCMWDKDIPFIKTNYLNYLYRHYGAKVYCGISNFINRKKIKDDKILQQREYNKKMENIYVKSRRNS